MTKFQNIDGAPQANHLNCHHVETQMEEAILFVQLAAGPHQTLTVAQSVTQVMNCARFGEEAHMENNANESTRESTQLHLPWDVWLPHVTIQQKREVYYVRKENTDQAEKEINVWTKPSSHSRAPSWSHQPVEEKEEDDVVMYFVKHAV